MRPLGCGGRGVTAAGGGVGQRMGVYNADCLEWGRRFRGRLDDEAEGNGME